MGFFTLDISKLTSNQTVQVVLSVAIIGGGLLTTNVFMNRTDKSEFKEIHTKLDTMANNIYYMNVEQAFQAEDNARIEDGLNALQDEVRDVRTVQGEIKEDHAEDITEILTLLRDQKRFDNEQMEYLWNELLKKNTSRSLIVDSLPSPPALMARSGETIDLVGR